MGALLYKQLCVLKRKSIVTLVVFLAGSALIFYLTTANKLHFGQTALVMAPAYVGIIVCLLCQYSFYEERKSRSIEKLLQHFGPMRIIVSSTIFGFLISIPLGIYYSLLCVLADGVTLLGQYSMQYAVESLLISIVLSTLNSWLLSSILILTDSQLAVMLVLIFPVVLMFSAQYYIYILMVMLLVSVILFCAIRSRRGRLF